VLATLGDRHDVVNGPRILRIAWKHPTPAQSAEVPLSLQELIDLIPVDSLHTTNLPSIFAPFLRLHEAQSTCKFDSS
jgi:hypothetical protein